MEINVNLYSYTYCHAINLGGLNMTVSYDKLWVILNERNMMKTDLVRAAKISTNAMAKLGRNEDVRVGVLVKICSCLGCTIGDVMDIIPEE